MSSVAPLSYLHLGVTGHLLQVQVTLCESHSIPGGAAHAWVDRADYHFESGPSLYSGMSGRCFSLQMCSSRSMTCCFLSYQLFIIACTYATHAKHVRERDSLSIAAPTLLGRML